MKIKFKFISLLIIILFFSVSLVAASDSDNQTLMVNNNDNGRLYIDDAQDYDLSVDESTPDNYTAGIGTFTELQNIIWASKAGDTIVLDKDYEVDSALVRQHVLIDRTLTIDGNGHTLDGKNSKRIFYIEPQSTNTVLKNINFVNGYHSQAGSAIFWRADNGILTGCTFTDNVANQNGGAVYWGANNGTAENNVFKNNKAGVEKLSSYQSGGAVYWEGNDGKVSNNQFLNNFALTNGGAITWKGNSGILKNNVFVSNLGIESGGAIYWDGSGALMDNNTFNSNTAELSGGAIYYEAENGVVSNSKFIKNTAKTNAGAIRWNGNGGTVTDSYFESNSASLTGGAIYWEGTKGKLINNEFIKNNADVSAGAVMWNANSATLDNNIYADNTAKEYGGAVYFKGNYSSLTNSHFKNNKASKSGAALYWEGINGQVNKNTFEDSISSSGSGAAIKWSGSNGVVNENNFKNSRAVSGGAIYWDGANGKLTNNNFTKSIASKAGGAVYWNSNGAEINGNIFDESITTSDYGGAIYYNGASSKINNNIFTNNNASKTGGAIYYNGNGNTANYNIFTSNAAQSGSGGAIRWNGNSATLIGNTFEDNTATYTGNSIYGEGDNGQITKNTFFNSEEGQQTLDWRGNNNDISDNIYGNSRETTLTMTDLTIYYGGTGKLVITLTNKNSKPLAKKDILLTFNNVNTQLSTDENGKAEYEIKDLTLGTYKATAKFAGDTDYDASQATATVTVKSTIESKDLTAEIGNVKYNATFLDSNGQALAKGEYVSFTVEGDVYRAQVGDNGVATATFDKRIGEYSITSTNTVTGETAKNKLKITEANPNLKVSAKDIEEGSDAVFDITANTQATGNVTLNINNINYQTPLEKGKAKITVSNLTAGKYQYTVTYAGNDNFTKQTVNGDLNVKSDNVIITAQNVTKYYGGSERLTVSLTDKTGAPLKEKTVWITINKKTYNRTTDDKGIASMALNLPSGNYTADILFKGDADYKAVNTTCNVVIKATVFGQDLTKIEKASKPYVATFLDSAGKPLAKGTEIEFNINGIFYKRTIGDDGKGALNINLVKGKYTITATNLKTGENTANTVIIESRIVNNTDVTKYYKNDTQYYVTVLDDNGNPVKAGETVTFNINGVFYQRTTNDKGVAELKLNLPPGDYVITAEYKSCKVANNIKILPVLSAKDLTKKYGEETPFIANLVDGQGKPLAQKEITFNINGVFYNKITEDTGMARLNINLLPGQYIITSSYNGVNIANRVTVTS